MAARPLTPTTDQRATRRTAIRAGAALAAGVPGGVAVQSAGGGAPGLEERLHEWIVGQEGPVSAVADAIRRRSAGASDPRRPMASFLFLGPQGVGKTHLAKAVAWLTFGSQDALTRVDMAAFDDPEALIASLRRRPDQVVLFDDVERAGAAALGWLRQILEGARLDGARGGAAGFGGAFVIVSGGDAAPGFVRRLTQTVRFLPLTAAQRDEVARRMQQGAQRGVRRAT